MKTAPELSSWKRHIALMLAHLEGLQSWYEREQRALATTLLAQFRDIETELRKLEAEVEPRSGTQHADRMVAQIESLKARGDMAYDLLRAAQERPEQPEATQPSQMTP